MGIVLLEAAHARQARQGAGEFVAVQHAKVGHADRQLPVRARAHVEHDAMAGAVHRLHRVLGALHVKAEHVFLVVLPMARALPELDVVDVGRDDLAEATRPVLLLDAPGWEKKKHVHAEDSRERSRRRELEVRHGLVPEKARPYPLVGDIRE